MLGTKTKLGLAVLATLALLSGAAFALVHRDRTHNSGPHYEPIKRAPASAASGKPNIVFIYTDDQNYPEFNRRYMPKTMRLLGDGGTLFSNMAIATPVCCPSRAAAFTGAYPHNNGVFSNHHGWGRLRDEQNTIAGWMKHAGYRTAWFGKFLQGYKEAAGDASIPAPGFDDWLVSIHPKYFGWKLFSNGPQKVLKGGKHSYFTNELTRAAVDTIDSRAQERRPLFMIVNQLGPHRGKGGKGRCKGTVAPAPQDMGRFGDAKLPRPPSFNRIDTAGQTAFPASGHLTAADVRAEVDKYHCRMESLSAVDRSVAAIYHAFKRAGEIDNTIFVFSSDNGLLYGEHGLTGKSIPYEEGIHMPFAIRVPAKVLGKQPVAQTNALVSNVDIAPTLLDLADASPCVAPGHCRALDGQSLVPVLRGQQPNSLARRAVLIEGGKHGDSCAYRGIRTATAVLLQAVKHADDGSCVAVGEPEYYDLSTDPHQLHNLAVYGDDRDQRRIAALQAQLSALEHCAGTAGAAACR